MRKGTSLVPFMVWFVEGNHLVELLHPHLALATVGQFRVGGQAEEAEDTGVVAKHDVLDVGLGGQVDDCHGLRLDVAPQALPVSLVELCDVAVVCVVSGAAGGL